MSEIAGTMGPLGYDFHLAVSRNIIAGHKFMSALGQRESMGTTATGEDIWPGVATSIPIPSSSGEAMTIVSSNVADNGTSSTGVLTLRIEYLDTNGLEQTEDIIVDGTTEVDTDAVDIIFVNDMYTLTVGSNGVAVGNITIYKKGASSTIYNMIEAGGNKSMVTNRMVPSGKSLSLRGWHAEEAQGKRCAFRVRSTDINGVLIPGVFLFKDVSYLFQAASSELVLTTRVPSLSIVKISGWADVLLAEASCGWWGILSDD